jgi:hypothetical protein
VSAWPSWFHLDDHARERLDLGKRAAETLALLGRELPSRPLLREALRSGRVRLRAAEMVLKLARGEAEEGWVERAATMTVRQLEDAVKKAGVDPARRRSGSVVALLRPLERELVDGAVELTGASARSPAAAHRAAHSHHVEYRGRGGGEEADNKIALCAFHHLRCVHAGLIRVVGLAPDFLTWEVGGEVWTGG